MVGVSFLIIDSVIEKKFFLIVNFIVFIFFFWDNEFFVKGIDFLLD